MRFAVVFSMAMATLASARSCGTEEPSKIKIAEANAVFNAAITKAGSVSALSAEVSVQARVVDLYFHVLRSGTAVSQGNIADSALSAQVSHGFMPASNAYN